MTLADNSLPAGPTRPQEHRGGGQLRRSIRHAGSGIRVSVRTGRRAQQEDGHRGGVRASADPEDHEAERREGMQNAKQQRSLIICSSWYCSI